MEETKEMKEDKQEKASAKNKTIKNKTVKSKTSKKGKHKEKTTLGDIVFRVLILVSIFFIALITIVTFLK